MTLLSICQAVCGTAPVAAPTSIVGNSNQTATMLLALANQAGQSLARKPQGGWVQMIREYDFTTSAFPTTGSGNGTIPGTVANVLNASLQTVGQITMIGQPLALLDVPNPQAWVANGTGIPNNAIVQTITSGSSGSPPVLTVIVTIDQAATQTGSGEFSFGQSDYVLPSDFQRPVDNTFWDRSRFWSMRGPQSPQQWQLYKSSVIGRASIQRRFRFRRATWLSTETGVVGSPIISIDPVPFDDGASLVFEYVSSGWCQSVTGTPQSQWLADTDTGVLDEYLLQLGLQWRFLRRLGLSYNEEMDDYERELDKAIATDGGSAILDLTPNDQLTLLGPWNLPETNFGNQLGS